MYLHLPDVNTGIYADQKFAPILEPFCSGPKSQVALINIVQVYCYEDSRVMKAFPQILKVGRRIRACVNGADRDILQVLYNKDCISDQAIIYWFQKGSKPQGRQHFLKATEPLVKVRRCVEETSLVADEFRSSCRNKRRRAMRKRSKSVS